MKLAQLKHFESIMYSIKEQKEEQDKLNEALDQYRKNLDDICILKFKLREISSLKSFNCNFDVFLS